MAATSVKVTATAAEVRAFARANGIEVGKRGRFAPSLVEAFNAQAETPYVEAGHVHTVTVTAKSKNHRTVTRNVSPAAVRAAAKAAGVEVGKQGRLPRSLMEAYVLGTL